MSVSLSIYNSNIKPVIGLDIRPDDESYNVQYNEKDNDYDDGVDRLIK